MFKGMVRSSMVALAALAIVAAPVSAANAHFVYADFSTYSGPITALNIDFHVAGLGNSSGATTATASGEYQVTVTCVNKAGKNPVGLQGPKTRTVNTQDVYPQKNGNYWGTLTINATPPICPRGMDYLASSFVVDWVDVEMTLSNSGGELDSFPIVYP